MLPEWLSSRPLLLDTNILVYAITYPDSFRGIFDQIARLKVVPVLEEMVHAEYLRGSKTSLILGKKNQALRKIFGDSYFTPPLTNQVLENVILLANICIRKDPNLNSRRLSMTDCVLMAQMAINNSIVLATADNGDFPLFLFDRFHIETIDLGSNILNIGFYQFRHDEYSKLRQEFEKS